MFDRRLNLIKTLGENVKGAETRVKTIGKAIWEIGMSVKTILTLIKVSNLLINNNVLEMQRIEMIFALIGSGVNAFNLPIKESGIKVKTRESNVEEVEMLVE